MCGIFGFAKKETLLSSLERFKLQGSVMDLLALNESRGRDGTGLFLASREESVIFKEAKPAGALLKTKRLRKLIRKISERTTVLLGHTRLATVGSVSSKNCHPFLTKDFAGVHNGYFLNRNLLLEKYKVKQETEVDSEAVFRVLDGAEGREVIAERLTQMAGGFALAFMRRRKPHLLYLIRDEDRPLHVVYLPELWTVLWSSEKRHLEYALARNFLKGVFLEVRENTLYEIDVRDFGKRLAFKKVPCALQSPLAQCAFSDSEDDFTISSNPYLYTYDELRHMGYLEDSGISERSKLACSLCEEQVEAGELYYDEVSGGSFCESCSFDYLSGYEKEEPIHQTEEYVHGQQELF